MEVLRRAVETYRQHEHHLPAEFIVDVEQLQAKWEGRIAESLGDDPVGREIVYGEFGGLQIQRIVPFDPLTETPLAVLGLSAEKTLRLHAKIQSVEDLEYFLRPHQHPLSGAPLDPHTTLTSVSTIGPKKANEIIEKLRAYQQRKQTDFSPSEHPEGVRAESDRAEDNSTRRRPSPTE